MSDDDGADQEPGGWGEDAKTFGIGLLVCLALALAVYCIYLVVTFENPLNQIR
jgi:hypothetical protein